MIIATTILVLSSTLIAALAVLKVRATETGNVSSILARINAYEALWEHTYRLLVRRFFSSWNVFVCEARQLCARLFNGLLGRFRFVLIHWGEHILDMIKGRGYVGKRGAASLYLKNITEYKQGMGSGKIEER